MLESYCLSYLSFMVSLGYRFSARFRECETRAETMCGKRGESQFLSISPSRSCHRRRWIVKYLRSTCNYMKLNYIGYLSIWLQIPLSLFFCFRGGGIVENQDSSGAWCGVFHLILLSIFVTSIFTDDIVIFRKNTVFFA